MPLTNSHAIIRAIKWVVAKVRAPFTRRKKP